MERMPEDVIRAIVRAVVETPFDIFAHWPFTYETRWHRRSKEQRDDLRALSLAGPVTHRFALEELERQLLVDGPTSLARLARRKEVWTRAETVYVSLEDDVPLGPTSTRVATFTSRLAILRDVLPLASRLRSLTVADFLGPVFPPDLLALIEACPRLDSLTLDLQDAHDRHCDAPGLLACLLNRPSLRRLALHAFNVYGTPTFPVPVSAHITALALHHIILADRDLLLLFTAVEATLTHLEWANVNNGSDMGRSRAWLAGVNVAEQSTVAGLVQAFGHLRPRLQWLLWVDSSYGFLDADMAAFNQVLRQLTHLRCLEITLQGAFWDTELWTSLPVSLRHLFMHEPNFTPYRRRSDERASTTIGLLAANLIEAARIPITTLQLSESVRHWRAFNRYEQRDEAHLIADLGVLKEACSARAITLQFCDEKGPYCFGTFGVGM